LQLDELERTYAAKEVTRLRAESKEKRPQPSHYVLQKAASKASLLKTFLPTPFLDDLFPWRKCQIMTTHRAHSEPPMTMATDEVAVFTGPAEPLNGGE